MSGKDPRIDAYLERGRRLPGRLVKNFQDHCAKRVMDITPAVNDNQVSPPARPDCRKYFRPKNLP